MRREIVSVVASLSLGPLMAACAPSASFAQSVVPAALAASCAGCHGAGGVSPGSIPSLAGLDASGIASMMRAFRSAPATEVTVMGRIARGFTDAEIDALSSYFATLPR